MNTTSQAPVVAPRANQTAGTAIADMVRSHGRGIVAVFDAHDPGCMDGVWRCPKACGWVGDTEDEWCDHLAGELADFLEVSA